jgi:hypothetical protein
MRDGQRRRHILCPIRRGVRSRLKARSLLDRHRHVSGSIGYFGARHVETPREPADAVAALVSEPNGPCGPESIREAEDRLYVRLPDDVRAFFARMNGTSDMTDIDHGVITPWPLERWMRLDDAESTLARGLGAGAVVFAEHSIECWLCAAQFQRNIPNSMTVWMVGTGTARLAPRRRIRETS